MCPTKLWERRSNFQGYKLKTYFENSDPWGYINDAGDFVGYVGDLGTMVAKKLNLTLDLKPIEVWGLKTKNGTFTGTIKDFKDNEADVGMAGYIQIAERLEVTDPGFTSLRLTTEMFYWKYDNSFIFGLVFRPALWCAVFISILISSLLLFVKFRVFQSSLENLMICQLLSALITNLSLIVVLDVPGNHHQSPSIRIHLLSMALCGALLFWTYSGVLVSYFSSDSEATPIESLDDLVNLPNLKIFIAEGTSYHQRLIRAIGQRPDLEETISNRIILKENYNDPEEEFRKSRHGANSIIVGSTLTLLHSLFTRKDDKIPTNQYF